VAVKNSVVHCGGLVDTYVSKETSASNIRAAESGRHTGKERVCDSEVRTKTGQD
jgi:hypothetical protein